MALLEQFGPPGHLDELSAAGRSAWHEGATRLLTQLTTDERPQFYNPTVKDTADDRKSRTVVWPAFPAQQRQGASDQQRWAAADADREVQDEYCEWSVRRDGDRVLSVTFTTELPEYWENLFEHDQDRLLTLYAEFFGRQIDLDDVSGPNGYEGRNELNTSTEGGIAHLVQGSNTLGAAVRLAADATIPREMNGQPVTSQQQLVICGGLGEPLRNSDPQIAAAVNDLARAGADITLEDPIGLYIAGLSTAGWVTPDGANPADFWTIERGNEQHILRATYEVPVDRGYQVSDITIHGRPIRFGAQIADFVGVKLTGLACNFGTHEPEAQPCV